MPFLSNIIFIHHFLYVKKDGIVDKLNLKTRLALHRNKVKEIEIIRKDSPNA